jgi:hypothetical protein
MQKLAGVADGSRQPDTLQSSSCQAFKPGEQEHQMPTAIITSKGVELLNDYSVNILQEGRVLQPHRDHHGLDRLWRREEDLGGIA